jgi:hypothetical protein
VFAIRLEDRALVAKINTFLSSLLVIDPTGPVSTINTVLTDEIQALPKPINAVLAS